MSGKRGAPRKHKAFIKGYTLTCRLRDEVRTALTEASKKHGQPTSELVRHILETALGVPGIVTLSPSGITEDDVRRIVREEIAIAKGAA